MVYANTTNGLRKPLENWSQINWCKVYKAVKNLRQRIFLARKLGNFKKLRSLQKLMQRNYANRDLITGWLKAGFIFEGKYNPTEMGTPQGGVISPLLANIGLHGLENFIKSTNPKRLSRLYGDKYCLFE